MADPAATDDPFGAFPKAIAGSSAGEVDDPNDPFAAFPKAVAAPTSATGAFTRGAARSIAPAAGGLVAAGAGAELGVGLGALTGPAAPVAVPALGFAGGVAGMMLGGAAVAKAQDWALSKLPDSWLEKIGMSDRQAQLDESQHSTASFLGGIAPYALTMSPMAAARKALPENATALQRIMANPATARLFGGAAMGGMELGQEAIHDPEISWPKVAISTGFGVVFNKPTRIGEAITGAGSNLARRTFGRAPTIAQAADVKVMGTGVTEPVFMGSQEQAATAAMTAQESARDEQSFVGPAAPLPDIHDTARAMHPETFARYDELKAQRDTFAQWVAEAGADAAPVAVKHLAAIEFEMRQLDPDISAAYRRAAEATGAPTVEAPPIAPTQFRSMAEMLAARGEGQPGAVDQTHDTRSGAVASKDTPGLTYVDPRIPEFSPILKDKDGNPANLHKYLAIHEQAEREAMAAGMSYDDAHTNEATPAERAAVEADGVDWKKYTEEMDGYLDKIEHEKVTNPPPDPHVDPNAAVGHHKSDNKAAPAKEVSVGDEPKEITDIRAAVATADRMLKDSPNNRGVQIQAQRAHDRLDELLAAWRAKSAQAPAAPGHLTVARKMPDGSTKIGKAGQIHTDLMTREELAADTDSPAVASSMGYATSDGRFLSRAEALEFAKEHEPDRAAWSAQQPQFGLDAATYNEATKPKAPTPEPKPVSSAEMVKSIADDVAKQLIAAGRSPQEARASAEVIAASYETRAARFKGALGTAQELYDREGAEIHGPGYRSPRTAQARPGGPAAKPESTWSLLEFLASRGGIDADDPLIADVRGSMGGGSTNKFVPGFGNLIRKGGMGLDRAREAAVESGYLFDIGEVTDRERVTTVNTLLEALDKELRGEKVYARNYAPEEAALDEDEQEHARAGALAQGELGQGIQAPPFYSAVSRAIESSKQEKASPQQWLATIKNTAGVKLEEMEWLGLEDWLKGQKGSVTKQQVADYVRANQIEVKETTKGAGRIPTFEEWYAKTHIVPLEENINDAPLMEIIRGNYERDKARMPREEATKFGTGMGAPLPGGENYREMLLTLPTKPSTSFEDYLAGYRSNFPNSRADDQMVRDYWAAGHGLPEGPGKASGKADPAVFKSSHWDEPNVLAHIRFDDRVIDGKKTLHLAEIQSDWHQKGRREGYKQPIPESERPAAIEKLHELERQLDAMHSRRDTGEYAALKIDVDMLREKIAGTGGTPDAPFKTTWQELSLKRMIRYAAENGYEKLSWDTGETNAARYDLSKQVDHIAYKKNDDGTFQASAMLKDGRGHPLGKDLTAVQLADQVGKDVADKIANGEGERKNFGGGGTSQQDWWTTLSGGDLKVGGEGMRGFYDKILPAAANKLGKKFGAKVGESSIDAGRGDWRYDGPELTHDQVSEIIRSSDPNMPVSVKRQLEDIAAADWGDRGLRGAVEDFGSIASAEALGGKTIETTKTAPVHTLDITSDLREAATEQGFPLFQGARGKMRPMTGATSISATSTLDRPIITLMKDANASTFIHESGHDFLEQMMRDAEHPAAPDDLKGDAKTTLDWLGVQSAADIKTRQHEKFARGFEQYLREGVAPSKELASVFAKFKAWLVSIYQTLKGLGEPISEDIKGVFDRMLVTSPERTVIAPERASGPTMAEIHESDAALTEPHEADAQGDIVIAERDRHITEPPPRIAHEVAPVIAADSTAAAHPDEARTSAGGSSQVEPDRGTPEPVPGSGGVGEGRGAELGRGGNALPEGAGVPGRAVEPPAGERVEPETARSHPLEPTPAKVFGPRESPFLDKAGNIRVENLTSREDVAQAIHDAADANDDFIGDRRGVVTDGQVLDLADALGMDAAKLNTRKIGQAFNAEQIVAARQLLIQSATDVAELMKRAADGDDHDVRAYAEARDRHQMIQAQVAGITGEAGRALRAFRTLAGQEDIQGVDQFLRAATGKTLFQLKEEAKLGAALQTPQQVSKFTADALASKRTFGRMILEYWINGLISGPATHTTYMVGNTILSLEKVGPETAMAALIGQMRAAMGREGETVRMGEVGAQLRGMGMAPALKAAADAFRTGVTTLLPGEGTNQATLPFQPGSELAQPAMLDEAARYRDAFGAAFGIVRGLRDGILAGGALLKAGGVEGSPLIGTRQSPLGVIPDITLRGVNVLPLGTAIRLPGRFIAGIHSFFRSVNYSMAKAGGAYRAAANEGLAGTAFDARVADIRQNPSESQMEEWRSSATDLTLMGKGSPFVQALSRLTNTEILGFPILKFIDPFVHIAGNIIDQSIVQRTPLGLLAPEIRADLSGKNGNIAQDMATARMLAGTGIAVAFGSLAAEGLISGSGPSDPKQSAIWRLAGNQAHSVRVNDTWYAVNKLGPMGMLLGLSADMYDVAHTAASGEYLQAASMLQHAVTQNILDESFMRGPAELIQALEDPGRYGEAYLKNFLSSFVPYSVAMSQIDRATDPYARQARTVLDAIRQKVPGLSEQLLPRRDIWGEEIPNMEALGRAGVTAIYEKRMSTDPLNLAMLNLGVFPAQIERKIRNVELTDQQYDDFSRIAGRMTKQRLDILVNSGLYQTWPNHVRHDQIVAQITACREAARGIMMMKYPQIPHDATQVRKDKARGIDK